MQTIKTDRLILRPFVVDDADSMFKNWANDEDVLRYMPYDVCTTLQETRECVLQWLDYFQGIKGSSAAFAIVLDGEVIGTIDYAESDPGANSAEIGYQLGKAWWGNGYAAEALQAIIHHCFTSTSLNRLWGTFDPRNANAGKVMEKANMVKEGTLREYKIRKGERVDRIMHSILKDDYDVAKEIAYYNSLPYLFEDFVKIPKLSSGDIYLTCIRKSPADPVKKYAPAYSFAVCQDGEKIGEMSLRIGYGQGPQNDNLYYGGHIGYEIDEEYRGNGYAAEACLLLAPVIKAHKMQKVLITNNITNEPSKRVCEKIGAKLIRIARLPKHNDLYKEGQRYINVFEWSFDLG